MRSLPTESVFWLIMAAAGQACSRSQDMYEENAENDDENEETDEND